MTLRRALTGGLFGLLLAAAAPVAAASAAPGDYPPDGDVTISLSASVVTVGGSVTVSGGGFRPGSTVDVTSTQTAQGFAPAGVSGFAGAPATERLAAVAVTASAAGTFSTSISFSEVGTFVVTAAGTSASGASASASATVQVLAAGGIGGGGDTGGDGSGSGSGGGASGVGGSGDDGGLPNTGASLVLPLTVGGILVLVGAGLVTATRRRKRGGVTV